MGTNSRLKKSFFPIIYQVTHYDSGLSILYKFIMCIILFYTNLSIIYITGPLDSEIILSRLKVWL